MAHWKKYLAVTLFSTIFSILLAAVSGATDDGRIIMFFLLTGSGVTIIALLLRKD